MVLKVHDFPDALGAAETWLLHAGIFGCFVAALLALLGLFWPRRFGLSATHVVAVCACLALGVYFVARFVAVGVEPLANAFEVLVLIAFGLMLAYFVVMLMRPAPALAAWIYPTAALIFLVALPAGASMGPQSVEGGRRAAFSDPLLTGHVILAVIATAHFVFAFLVSVAFLVQDRALRRKRDSGVGPALPSLERLERMTAGALTIGFPTMTVSLILGFIVVWGDLARWMTDPMVMMSLAMWVVFAVAVVGRLMRRVRGKREMYLVVAGFVLVVAAYFGAGLLPAGAHSFALCGRLPAASDDARQMRTPAMGT